MSVSVPLFRKYIFVSGFALALMGSGLGGSLILLALEAEPIPIQEIGAPLFKVNMDKRYTYTVGNRRDPFIPLPVTHSPEDLPVTPLPEFENPEGGLRVVGIISGKHGYQALLKLPSGERVIVGPGGQLKNTPLTVKRITNDSVVITRSLEEKGSSRILETTFLLSP